MSAQVQVSSTTRPGYVKSFIPLESNPSVFTPLLQDLIGSTKLEFVDVLSFNDPDLLSFVPRPVHALVLAYHQSPVFTAKVAEEEAKREEYKTCGEEEDVVWFKQTIHNACGFYALLHATVNGTARGFIEPKSTLSQILEKAIPLPPKERVHVLEESAELEAAYTAIARSGDSIPPEHPDDDVRYHYMAFVRSPKTGSLFDMNGSKKGPVDFKRVLSEGEDLLSDTALEVVRDYLGEEGTKYPCSMLALVETSK